MRGRDAIHIYYEQSTLGDDTCGQLQPKDHKEAEKLGNSKSLIKILTIYNVILNKV